MNQQVESVTAHDERDRLTHEALASLHAGFRVPQAEVRKWAESLNTVEPLPLPKSS